MGSRACAPGSRIPGSRGEWRRPWSRPPVVLCEGSASQPAVPVETDARLRFMIHSEKYRESQAVQGLGLRSHCPEPEFSPWSGN